MLIAEPKEDEASEQALLTVTVRCERADNNSKRLVKYAKMQKSEGKQEIVITPCVNECSMDEMCTRCLSNLQQLDLKLVDSMCESVNYNNISPVSFDVSDLHQNDSELFSINDICKYTLQGSGEGLIKKLQACK